MKKANTFRFEIHTYDWNQAVTMHSDSKNVGQADWAKFVGETVYEK